MILVSYLLKWYPVTDMGRHQGYNTLTSRKSQDHWDYAQSIAPNIFMKYGKILFIFILILSGLCLLQNRYNIISIYLGMAIGFIFVIVSFFIVEKQIRKKFPN